MNDELISPPWLFSRFLSFQAAFGILGFPEKEWPEKRALNSLAKFDIRRMND